MKEGEKRMLVVRLSALGDVAMTVPVVYSLAQSYPDLQIDFLTRPFAAQLFVNAPENLHTLCYHPDKDVLKGRRYDFVADLHNVARSWRIDMRYWFKDVKVAMVDKRRSERRKVVGVGHLAQPWFVDRYCEVFARLGFPVELAFKSLFEGYPPLPMPLTLSSKSVGFAPFARYSNKTLPEDISREVVERLAHRGWQVVLFGARGVEEKKLEKWATEIRGVRSVAGLYTLDRELAIMSRLKLMISMDSANGHLAALAGIPVVTVWGSTTTGCGFKPFGADNLSVVAGEPCQPCTIAGSEQCRRGDMGCLRALTASRIVDAVVTRLEASASSSIDV